MYVLKNKTKSNYCEFTSTWAEVSPVSGCFHSYPLGSFTIDDEYSNDNATN